MDLKPDLKTFADDMVRMGRELGIVQGLKLASAIMREHGIPVDHPARVAVFSALMGDEPPPPAAPSA